MSKITKRYNREREIAEMAEKSLLGTILLLGSDRQAIDYAHQLVTPEDFRDYQFKFPHNQRSRIYKAMLLCDIPDQLRVAEKLNELGLLASEVINGIVFSDIADMSMLMAECPCALDYPYYAVAVHTYGDKRRELLKAREIKELADKGDFKRVAEVANKAGVLKGIEI